MLFEALGKLKHQIIISSVVMMILGLLLLIIPEQYDGILIHILGYAAILLGAVMVWDFIGGNRKLKDFILFIVALLLMVLGIYVLVSGGTERLFWDPADHRRTAQRSPCMDVRAPCRQKMVVAPASSMHAADRSRYHNSQ